MAMDTLFLNELLALVKQAPEACNLELIYNKYFLEQSKIPFDDYFKAVVQEDMSEQIEPLHIKNLKVNLARNINRTKKTWFKSFDSEFEKEKVFLSLLSPQELFGIYKTHNLDDIQLLIKSKIEVEWVSNKKAPLSAYRYFQLTTPSWQKKFFKNDVLLFVCTVVIEDFNGSLSSPMLAQVASLIDHPIFSPKRHSVSFDEGMSEDNEPILFNDYEIDGNYILRYIVKERDGVKIDSLYLLDSKDWQIINYVLSKVVTVNFLKTRTIEVDAKDIVQNVYKTDSANSYRDVVARIKRIPLYHISGIMKRVDKEEIIFSINFFDSSFVIVDEKTGNKRIKIVFGEVLYNSFVNGMTVKISERQARMIDDDVAKILFFALQKERLQLYALGISPLTCTLGYSNFFRRKIRLKGSLSAQMKKIEKAFAEYKEKNVLIKDYTVGKGFVTVEFYPITPSEKASLKLQDLSLGE